MNKNYDYKFLSIKEQVNHLKNNRNLEVSNSNLLELYFMRYNYENFVNLYHKYLSKPNTKIFLDGVTSDTLIDIFNFDRSLSLRLLFDILELERIITTKLIYVLPKYFYDNKEKYSNNDNNILLEIEKLNKGEILTLSAKTLLALFPKLKNSDSENDLEKQINDFRMNINKYVPEKVLNNNASIWKIAIYWSTGTLHYIFNLLDNDAKIYFIKQFDLDIEIYPCEMSDILLMLNRLRNRICHNNMVYEFTFQNSLKNKNGKPIYPQPLSKIIKKFYKYKTNQIRMKQVTEIFDIFIKTSLKLDLQRKLDEFCNKVDLKVTNKKSKDEIIKNIKQHMRF